jgi:hypothetical protein
MEVRGAALEAGGRHEDAAAAHLAALADTDRAGPAGCRAAATRLMHAYAAVADWDGLDAWRARVDEMRVKAAAGGAPEVGRCRLTLSDPL